MTTEQTEVHPSEYIPVYMNDVWNFRKAQEQFPLLGALLDTMISYPSDNIARVYGLDEYPADNQSANILTGNRVTAVSFRLSITPTRHSTPEISYEVRSSTLDIYTLSIEELVDVGWNGRQDQSPLFARVISRDILSKATYKNNLTINSNTGDSELELYSNKFRLGPKEYRLRNRDSIGSLGEILSFADRNISNAFLQFDNRPKN